MLIDRHGHFLKDVCIDLNVSILEREEAQRNLDSVLLPQMATSVRAG